MCVFMYVHMCLCMCVYVFVYVELMCVYQCAYVDTYLCVRSYSVSHFVFTTGTNRYFQRVVAQFGITSKFVDCTDLSKLKEAIKPNTKVT